MRVVRPLPFALAAAAFLAAACSHREPSDPGVASIAPLAQHGTLQLRASFVPPGGRGRGDSIIVQVQLRNAGPSRVQATTSAGCPVSVRLLAAAAGDGASATFYDDFQRPCNRMAQVVDLSPGEAHTFRHAIPMTAISPGAPRAVQAHVGVVLDGAVVLITGGTFELP